MEIILGIDTSIGDQFMKKLLEVNEASKLKNVQCYVSDLKRPNSCEWTRKNEGVVDHYLFFTSDITRTKAQLEDGSLEELVEEALETFHKCFVVIQQIRNDVNERFQLQREFISKFVDKQVQISFVTDLDSALDMATDLTKSLSKDTTNEDPFVDKSKPVRIVGDSKCGLKKLWHSQVEVVYKYARKKKELPPGVEVRSPLQIYNEVQQDVTKLTENVMFSEGTELSLKTDDPFIKEMKQLFSSIH